MDNKFLAPLYVKIKIPTLQDRTLHMYEGSPLLSKACNSTWIIGNTRE